MFCNARTGGCRNKRGGCRDVKKVGAIAARADKIDQMAVFYCNGRDQLAHDLGCAGDFVNGLAFHAQGHQQRTNLCLGGLAGHHCHHDRTHRLSRNILARHPLLECLLKRHVGVLAIDSGTSCQKLTQHSVAVFGENRLGVKLHPLNIELAVAEPHNRLLIARFILGPGSDFKTLW